jgi:hypothetical protein
VDNPIPSLFKERLFVYLSRFCEVRYCFHRFRRFGSRLKKVGHEAEAGENRLLKGGTVTRR